MSALLGCVGVSFSLLSLVSGCSTSHKAANSLQPQHAGTATGVALTGEAVDPLSSSNAKAVVLVFVRTDCPIANRYAPEIEKLYQTFAARKVSWWLVYPDGETSPTDIKRHLEEYHLSLKALRDPAHDLVKLAGVSVTPEVAVFLANGHEVYHGRIDDRYEDFGKERPQATRHDLAEVLNAVLQGKPVPAGGKAVGCYINERTQKP